MVPILSTKKWAKRTVVFDWYGPIVKIGTEFFKLFEIRNYFLIIYKVSEK